MSGDKIMNSRDEMETLLPFYLNGTLSGADLAAVEDWLANDPGAEAALLEAESELDLITLDNESIRPHPNAFRRFSDSLEKEPGPSVSPVSRLSAWFGKTFAVPAPLVWASAAAAAAFALVVVTVGIPGRQPANDIEIAGSGETGSAAFALVTFNPDAPLAGIAKLLQATGGRIADGPSADGTVKIVLPAATLAEYDRLTAELAKSPLVDKVIPGRKPDAAK
jgi:hypothetical protein